MIRCNKCGHVGEESEFPKDRDFFQHQYIAGCPKCDNRQDPGSASMRMFGGKRPFETVDGPAPSKDPLTETLRRAGEVS
jgi:hypothetical protein